MISPMFFDVSQLGCLTVFVLPLAIMNNGSFVLSGVILARAVMVVFSFPQLSREAPSVHFSAQVRIPLGYRCQCVVPVNDVIKLVLTLP
jgi:hypothetical protein